MAGDTFIVFPNKKYIFAQKKIIKFVTILPIFT